MRKFVLILLAFAVGVASTGCATRAKPGVAVVKSPPDAAAIPCTVAVPQTGKYELRREGGTAAEIPLAIVEVPCEARMGFLRRADGSVVAQAGPAEIPVPEGTYFWTLAPESELTGPRLRWYLAKQTGKGILLGTGILLVSGLVFLGGIMVVILAGKYYPSDR